MASTTPTTGLTGSRQRHSPQHGQWGQLSQDIAIIGFSCRFGGDASNNEEFWSMICEGRTAHSKSGRPEGQQTNTSPDPPTYPGHYLRQDPYAFDANFFNISGKEAMAIDPSQRLMLEVAHEAFESSGLTLDAISGSDTSCYVGQFVSDYREMLFRDPDFAPICTVTGSGTALISNRLSWFFDLKGPSFTLNTACSSGMVALHEACESLRRGESAMSIVGGSNLILSTEMFTYLKNQGFLAADGKCKSFDVSANGYGRGEGVAALILKRVDDAIDNDPIRAVIRGTGVNQNGRTKGITLPDIDAQRNLIRKTYQSAGLQFGETTYVEAHGTGTAVGDPIEMGAIAETLGVGRESRKKLLVGSSKPNIGHTEATAGLAGIIKGILALESGLIPPNVYFVEPNPKILLDRWNLAVPRELTVWPSESLRRMSVCSSGYSGTNAHVILDDAYSYLMRRGRINALHFTKTPGHVRVDGKDAKVWSQPLKLHQESPSNILGPRRLYVLSAQDEEGTSRQRRSLSTYLRRQGGQNANYDTLLANLALTLSEKRSKFIWCSWITARSMSELQFRLGEDGSHLAIRRPHEQPRLCFVFTGQGAQWAQMGLQLYDRYPVFRESVDAAADYFDLAFACPWSVTTELFAQQSTSRIDDPEFSQALCTVLQVALVDLLESWEVIPTHIVGHSSGEIAGAYCRGALSREDAWRVAYYRGLLSSRMLTHRPDIKGGMLAVALSESEAEDVIASKTPGKAVVACINSPNSTTLSGDVEAIDSLENALKSQGTFVRRLNVRNAYHSPHMEHVAGEYVYAIRQIQPKDCRAQRKMYSAVTGDLIDPWELGPLSWMKNLVSPVRFSRAVQTLLASGADAGGSTSIDLFLEIGPHAALSGPVKQIIANAGMETIPYISVLQRGKDGLDTAMDAAGFLYTHGVPVDISAINSLGKKETDCRATRLLVNLPTYSWNHSRSYNGVSRIERENQRGSQSRGRLLGKHCPSMGDREDTWRGAIELSRVPWLYDHNIDGTPLFPAAAYLVLVLEAARQVAEPERKIDCIRFRDVNISSALVVPEDGAIEVVVHLRPHYQATRDRSATWTAFTVSSWAESDGLRENCIGLVSVEYEAFKGSAFAFEKGQGQASSRMIYEQFAKDCEQYEDKDDFYSLLSSLGLRYGPNFRKMSNIKHGNGRSTCVIETQPWETVENVSRPSVIHPATFDAMFHAVFAAAKDLLDYQKGSMVPVMIEEVTVSEQACSGRDIRYVGTAAAKKQGFQELVGDIDMLDCNSLEALVQVRGLTLRFTSSGAKNGNDEVSIRQICNSIEWQPAEMPEIQGSKPTCEVSRELVILHTDGPNSLSASMEKLLRKAFIAHGVRTKSVVWPTPSETFHGARCISLLDLDNPKFLDPSEEEFCALQSLIMDCASLLWVLTDGTSGSLALGLARAVRNEIPSLVFRTCQVSSKDLQDRHAFTENIVSIACSACADAEFRQEDGRLLVPRVICDAGLNVALSDLHSDRQTIEQQRFDSLPNPTDLSVLNPGILSSLYFAQRKSAPAELGTDEVEIAIQASGLNFRDVMVAMGAIPDLTMGFEASGTVTAVGSGVSRFRIGDQVCTLGHGAHCSLFRNKEMLTQPLPPGMSFEEAATLPLIHVTSYNALVRLARAKKGQSVLIHAAAGGVGQSAVQLAKHIGMEIFVTVGSEDKRALLRNSYSISDDHIFSSRDSSFASAVKRMTGGRGVDVVLNSLAGESLRQSWHCIAPFGTFVEIGLRDIQNNFGLDMRPFMQDATFTFFNVSRMIHQAPEIVEELLESTFTLIRKGILQPVSPLTTFPISDIESAFRTMQTGKHRGKIALSWTCNESVRTLVSSHGRAKLDPNATYILAGGLGGLGRSLAQFMAGLGAQHICFISRSGAQSEPAKQVLAQLQKMGVNASAYRGDISDHHSLRDTLEQCRKEHPPIRGVVQCAMVLRDTLFEKMTFSQWHESLRPKVAGSANLDKLLPDDMDFFIMLSSFVGIFGNMTQSNYAAACVYQDALAYERRARGLRAVALDLGVMRDVGYLAEHGALGHLKEWEMPFGMREAEFHSLMHVAMIGDCPAQIITGLATATTFERADIKWPFFFTNPVFSQLAQAQKDHSQKTNGSTATASQRLQDSLRQAASKHDALAIVLKVLGERVAKSLQLPLSDVDADRSLNAHGVDSLVATEIRTWISQDLKANISIFDLTASTPMKLLVPKILSRCELLPAEIRAF